MTLQDGGNRTGCQVREFVIDFPVGKMLRFRVSGFGIREGSRAVRTREERGGKFRSSA